MTIVSAGGGSGGHVTPVLAVLGEVNRISPRSKFYFVTDRGFYRQANAIMKGSSFKIKIKKISAGKFRRYHNVSFIRHILDISTLLKNFIDVFKVGVGIVQSIIFLMRVKPDVVFTKGGFVCLPVGLAAKLLNIPLVIHDSDAHPGLTNRMLARFATSIATGEAIENYPDYPAGKTHHTGIPVSADYKPVNVASKLEYRKDLEVVDIKKPLILVTGGGLGSRNLNSVILNISKDLVERATVVHITGQANYREVLEKAPDHPGYQVVEFISKGMHKAINAADVVITRAGGTALQEMAACAKPIVLIPSPYLASGHQLKNSANYQEAGAAVVMDEDDIILHPIHLRKQIMGLLDNPKERLRLAKAIYKFAKPHASIDVASLVVEAAAKKRQA